MTLTVGSLFSGIGGLDLGLERAGMNVIWQSEINPYASKVLAKHWPGVPNYGDIKEIEWGNIVRPDVICGGYPCQPFSTAGKRNGTDDPRHLWPWVRDAISVLRPQYAILENVRGHVSLGLSTVLGEMADIGYDAEWQIVSAASVGAPHLRERIVIVAYPNSGNQTDGRERTNVSSEDRSWGNDRIGSGADSGKIGMGITRETSSSLADSNDSRSRTSERDIDRDRTQIEQRRQDESFIGTSRRCSTVADDDSQRNGLDRAPETIRQARIFRGDNTRREAANVGREWWKIEPDLGRVANGIPARVDRLKGLGNAVVPQVAELVGRLVVEHSKQ